MKAYPQVLISLESIAGDKEMREAKDKAKGLHDRLKLHSFYYQLHFYFDGLDILAKYGKRLQLSSEVMVGKKNG